MSLDDGKVTAFLKEFRDLWVAGMTGTFFFFTWRSLAQDILGATPQFAADSSFDRTLRYSFLLWLFGYFFVAGTENKINNARPTPQDLTFDVVQSVFSIIAAVFLGFVLQLPRNDWCAYFAASLAVAMTGGLSLLLFVNTDSKTIDALRLIALIVGIVLAGLLLWQSVSLPGPPSPFTLRIVGIGHAILWVVLLVYLWARLKRDGQ